MDWHGTDGLSAAGGARTGKLRPVTHGAAEDKARVFEPVRGRYREIGGVRWANESDQRCCASVIGSQGGFPEPLAGSEAKVEGTKVPLL